MTPSNFLDLKWYKGINHMLRQLAQDPYDATKVIAALDADLELKEELIDLYHLAQKTLREYEEAMEAKEK